jgi:predicted RNA-binding protein
MRDKKYWIAVVSKDHTMRGIAGSFMQVCHGKQAPLKRMQQGDRVLFYSAKQTIDGSDKLQAFTAIGEITDTEVYAFKMSETFIPFRRNVKFSPCKEVSIQPLINELNFIPDKKSWGYPFRYGFLEISQHDFKIISDQMLGQ